ncbi:hypothetical protein [Mechercharimyces sp. CAU 1602]|uniref:hypothetical protein n=1 Tax=Mechercharimyces sp. CAU 1602 TaxID=2973933 RepID=UPI002163AE23|nr:hypothetical protein [Mechercharimyces sp. CAU 1602]
MSCDLCNTPNLKTNYIIVNIYNNNRLYIGNECFKKFQLILQGASTVEESEQMRKNRNAERDNVFKLRSMYPEVVKTKKPYARHFTAFKKVLIEVLEIQGLLSCRRGKDGALRAINHLFKIEQPSEAEVQRMYDILNDVSFPLLRESLKRQKQLKEGDTFKRKGRVTHTTVSKSGIYRNH